MEEPKAPEPATQPCNPPTTTAPQNLPPHPPPHSTTTTKKRPLEHDDSLFQNSNYLKIRTVVRDLRPHFIEVLLTPDYQSCKASHEIRDQLKILMKLYDNLREDVVSLGKCKNMQDGQNLEPQHLKSPEQLQVEKTFARSSEVKPTPSVGLQIPQTEDCQTLGTYVVGGSAFGWNFITYSGNEPVYYGRTKEQFRAVNELSNSVAPGLNQGV